MKIKDFFLVSKILMQSLFVWWLLIFMIIAITFAVFAYDGKEATGFIVFLFFTLILGALTGGSEQIVHCLPLQPHIQRDVFITVTVWSVLLFYSLWQIAAVDNLVKFDESLFSLPICLLLIINSARLGNIVVMFPLSILLSIGYHALHRLLGESYTYVTIVFLSFLAIMYWRLILCRYHETVQQAS